MRLSRRCVSQGVCAMELAGILDICGGPSNGFYSNLSNNGLMLRAVAIGARLRSLMREE